MPAGELKDVRPPVVLPENYSWLWFILAALIIAVLAFFGKKLLLRFRSALKKPVVQKAAWEIALEEIRALKIDDLPSKGEVKEYYVRLSGIVRHYLERRFSLSAPEMTTEEFVIHVRASLTLNDQQKNTLKDFLTISDRVKFARGQSSPEEMSGALDVAERLVRETVPAPVTPQNVK